MALSTNRTFASTQQQHLDDHNQTQAIVNELNQNAVRNNDSKLTDKRIPATGSVTTSTLDQTLQTAINKAITALQTAPVASVNTKTGAVSLTASDVGAVATNDPKLTDQRTPSDGSVTAAKLATSLSNTLATTSSVNALQKVVVSSTAPTDTTVVWIDTSS